VNRKDEHLDLAYSLFPETSKNFADVRIIHHSLAAVNPAAVDLSSTLAGLPLKFPYYINAMTGGSSRTKAVNAALAQIAKENDLLMASGSCSAALKDPTLWPTFSVIRKVNPSGILLANVGAEVTPAQAQEAVARLEADGLQIHLNSAQELIMPEGDRHFYDWQENISEVAARLPVPVVVKEVGFGMSRETMHALSAAGVRAVDVSGRGGTNFAKIENARRSAREFADLANWGQTTVESLLEASVLDWRGKTLLASGGVTSALDVFKCLALGADAAGVAGWLLHQLLENGPERASAAFFQWQNELRTLFSLTGCRNIADTQRVQLILEGSALNWCALRGISAAGFAERNR
jgi:isopentenyl-diphosphate delta-isomerase